MKAARAELLKLKGYYGICGRLPWTDAGYALRAYINRQLGVHAFLEDWLREHRPNLPRTAAARRKYRLQWIDWMIASLEGKV